MNYFLEQFIIVLISYDYKNYSRLLQALVHSLVTVGNGLIVHHDGGDGMGGPGHLQLALLHPLLLLIQPGHDFISIIIIIIMATCNKYMNSLNNAATSPVANSLPPEVTHLR